MKQWAKDEQMIQQVQGYAEGYYGRLPSWEERSQLLDTLASNQQNTYYYAPKEDPCHRLQWRTPYSTQWRDNFARFCEKARQSAIQVVAGIAPGLDFDFNHLQGGADIQALKAKAIGLLEDGASGVSLLLDDIDENFAEHSAGIASEGEAHALLANLLGEALEQSLWITPRVYANELARQSPHYLPDFLRTLDSSHTVIYCGSDVVARIAATVDIQSVSHMYGHAMILWDNLYANDYCPRRLYLGEWSGRSSPQGVLLNPTGMINTDRLLLDLMACGSQNESASGLCLHDDWWGVLQSHGVPACFKHIARYFYHPVFNDQTYLSPALADATTMEAIEHCLWRWKTPLSREWYPYIFGLKHDLLLATQSLPDIRIQKTQNPPLVERLLGE